MLKRKPLPKVKQVNGIPDDLREFMADVREQIRSKDESAVIPSDDLLQSETAYGGLEKKGQPWYGFVYFPARSTHPKWTLRFHVTDIERIADGAVGELTLWSCKDKACGNQFFDPKDTCFYCDYLEADGTRRTPTSPEGLKSGELRITWAASNRPNSKELIEVPTLETLEPELKGLAKSLKERTLVSISSGTGSYAVLGLGGTPSIVMLGPVRGLPMISRGETDKPGTLGFASGQDWKDLPARHGVPEEQAIQAATRFLSTGQLPDTLRWEEASPGSAAPDAEKEGIDQG